MTIQRIHRRNYNIPGQAHALTFCCYKRFAFLKSERTCLWLCESINQARIELDFDVWAYVFMPDHAHLIVNPRQSEYDIAEIRTAIKHPTSKAALAWLRTNSADWLPRLTRCRGKRIETLFWQSGGGYDRNVERGDTLLKMVEYIHMNPVRKQFVSRAEDWWWSSAGQFVGMPNTHLLVDTIRPECLA